MKRTALLGLLLLVAACTAVAAPLEAVATATIGPSHTSTIPIAPITETATIPTKVVPQRSLYILKAVFDYEARSLAVYEQIDFVNNTSGTLTELRLLVEAQNLRTNFNLLGLSGANVSDFKKKNAEIQVELAQPLLPGQTTLLELHYELHLSKQSSWLGWTGRQFNFIDWYPYIPSFSAETGWLIHASWPVGEHLVFDSSDFEVQIQIENGPSGLVIAAAAPSVQNPQGASFSLYNARRFAWSASDEYRTLQTEQDGVQVTAYVFPEHLAAGRVALATSARALNLYQQLFGPYPHESLAVVEGDFFDGMESDALFFLDTRYFGMYNGGAQNYLTMLSAHETAHNWWYGSVGNDPALDPWMDEALAIYSEELYYENIYPDLVGWWWQFRIYDRQPAGPVDITIYETNDFLVYVAAVYRRGAEFVHALRISMGDRAFFAFLQDYAGQGASRIMTADDFFSVLGNATSEDLEPIISEYFGPQE
jgi:hypothetical protein